MGSSASRRLWFADQGAGQRDPLLFAARQLARPVPGPVGKPDVGEHLAGRGSRGRRGGTPEQQGHHDVFQRGEFRQQVVELKHEADGAVAEAGQAFGDRAVRYPAPR